MIPSSQHWWEHLKSWWMLPLKPKHVDRLAEVRRKRFKHVMRTAAQRDSFRVYWREVGDTMTLPEQPRGLRRRIVLRAWRQEKRKGTLT